MRSKKNNIQNYECNTGDPPDTPRVLEMGATSNNIQYTSYIQKILVVKSTK